MITNTDNSILPAGMSTANRAVANPQATVAVKAVGSSTHRDATGVASLKQGTVGVDGRTDASQRQPIETNKSLEEVADALSRTYGEMQSLQFSVDKDTGVSVIKVTQSGTGEVVRQIPNEEALQMLQRLDSQQGTDDNTAVLFDKMA